jgi:hypothetical protein
MKASVYSLGLLTLYVFFFVICYLLLLPNRLIKYLSILFKLDDPSFIIFFALIKSA